jgi:hypothetical protein
VSGVDVNIIGADNMRIVEDAFTYRLVWALEAIRTRRISLGWSPDIVAGGAAATLETSVPQFLMAMLIRAGLPCAAMNAIREGSASFFTPADMRDWLSSNEIAALTDLGDCPRNGRLVEALSRRRPQRRDPRLEHRFVEAAAQPSRRHRPAAARPLPHRNGSQ